MVRRLIRRVFAARRFAAFLIVALWVPAMLHCRLEAAGLLFASETCGAATGCAEVPAADHGCAEDLCDVAEGDFSPRASIALRAPAPVLHASLLTAPQLIPAPIWSPPVEHSAIESTAAPPELARPWVFVAPGPFAPRAP